ncbi:unnamed protein product [Effrenium voratum]|nr:unnamed protein product [Effrenium voratum]
MTLLCFKLHEIQQTCCSREGLRDDLYGFPTVLSLPPALSPIGTQTQPPVQRSVEATGQTRPRTSSHGCIPWMLNILGEDCEGGAFASDRVPLPGDYYREPDDVLRGLTLEHDVTSSFSEESYWMMSSCRPFTEQVFQKLPRDADATHWRFQRTDVPPDCPQESSLEATSFHLQSAREVSWEVGNRLLDFLELHDANITKVNRLKFTAKAQVLCSGLVCEIKIRVYQDGDDRILILVHRVRGDGLAFSELFRLLKQHLLATPASSSASRPPSVSLAAKATDVYLQPLVEAAHNAEDTEAKAEAAAGLAAAAEDTGVVEQLCHLKGASCAVKRLLEVNCFEVSCQVARLLLKLAVVPGAEAFFQDGVLRLLQDKVQHLATGRMLKTQLLQAVERLTKAAMASCAEVQSYVQRPVAGALNAFT